MSMRAGFDKAAIVDGTLFYTNMFDIVPARLGGTFPPLRLLRICM